MRKKPLLLIRETVTTPIGGMLVVTDERECVRAIDWDDYVDRMRRLLRLHYGEGGVEVVGGRLPRGVRDAIDAYLAGAPDALGRVQVETAGTAFQRSVWSALRLIPTGTTTTYAALAKAIGRPRAVRAVGLANGANPVGVVVPCHRVIGADRSLTGFGGGLVRKRWLLEHEGVRFDDRGRAVCGRDTRDARGPRSAFEDAKVHGVPG